jgi:hypothetical protein
MKIKNLISSIFSDFIDKLNLSPDKLKFLLKIIIKTSITLISGAFIIGKIYGNFERKLDENTKATNEMRQEMHQGFNSVNQRIDVIYNDGYKEFTDYQDYNKKQFELVIDYSSTNKELLKKVLELNNIEKTKSVENNLNLLEKTTNTNIDKLILKNNNYISLSHIVSKETKDTIFYLIGATKEFVNKINNSHYDIINTVKNSDYPYLTNITYRSFGKK